MRDLTARQFRAALERNGMKLAPFGYVEIDGGKLAVNRLNGGFRFRSQLAYLLREKEKYDAAKLAAIAEHMAMRNRGEV